MTNANENSDLQPECNAEVELDDSLPGGWQLRFVSSDDRVAEAIELYAAIGYDTHVIPAPALCTGCAIATACQHKAIYTRRR